jgi:ABC-type bacteriocin/lantibiotic exporter with double-glycine peptidase domain
MNINFKPSGQAPRGIFAQLFTALLGLLVLGAALLFSFVFFAVLAVAVLLFGGYFWWKTRALRAEIRKQMQAQAEAQQSPPDFVSPAAQAADAGEIIEGEAVRVPEEQDRLPR